MVIDAWSVKLRLLGSRLAAGALLFSLFFLPACESEKGRIERLAREQLQQDLKERWLIPGAEVRSVEVKVTGQAGLEFTATARARVEFPDLYQPISPQAEDADAQKLEDQLRAQFEAAISIPDENSRGASGQVFSDLCQEVDRATMPPFSKSVEKGEVAEFVYDSVDGRLAGEGVRLQSLSRPRIDAAPEEAARFQSAYNRAPEEAKIYESIGDFRDAYLAEFKSRLTEGKDELQRKLEKTLAAERNAIVGTWEGFATQRIVDPRNYRMLIEFLPSGQCTGFLAEDARLSGIGVTEIKKHIRFGGTWKTAPGKVLVSVAQQDWSEKWRQVAGPGSGEPETEESKPVAAEPMEFPLSYQSGSGVMTFSPIGITIADGEGSPVQMMVPLSLRKQE
jgi:hypothetical protein